MYQLDLTTITGFLASVWAVLQGVLALDPEAYIAVLTQDGGGRISLAVLFLAGLSITIGQSVVLFANRVGRRRFIFSLILSSVLLIIGILFWATTVWLLAAFLFDAEQSLRLVLIVVSLSYAPLLYGVFVLLPYLGNIIFIFLRIWILVGVVGAVMVIFPLAIWQALVCCLLGWVLLEITTRFPLIAGIENWLWRVTTGRPELMTTEDVVDSFVKEMRASSQVFNTENSDEDESL